LFAAIRRDQVYEMESYLLDFVEKRIDTKRVDAQRAIVDAAWVVADLGNVEKAQEITEQIIEDIDLSFSGHAWILGDILKGIHLLPPEYALTQIEKIWGQVKEDALLPTYCIEALERIGTQPALDMLARIAQETSELQESGLETERALRAIQKVSPAGREDWLVEFLDQEHKDKYTTQRVIDTLGVVGSEKALPIIQQYFENHPSERIRYVAFWAIHNIHKANNEVWYNNEEAVCS